MRLYKEVIHRLGLGKDWKNAKSHEQRGEQEQTERLDANAGKDGNHTTRSLSTGTTKYRYAWVRLEVDHYLEVVDQYIELHPIPIEVTLHPSGEFNTLSPASLVRIFLSPNVEMTSYLNIDNRCNVARFTAIADGKWKEVRFGFSGKQWIIRYMIGECD